MSYGTSLFEPGRHLNGQESQMRHACRSEDPAGRRDRAVINLATAKAPGPNIPAPLAALHMSAYGPKHTSVGDCTCLLSRVKRPYQQKADITYAAFLGAERPIPVFIGSKRDCDYSSSWLRRTSRS